MSAQTYQSAFAPVKRHRAMICGVCLRVAETTGLPVWVPRLAFIVLAIQHAILSVLLYVGAAMVCHRRAVPGVTATARPSPKPFSPEGSSDLRDCFSRLEARLAAMEAETWHNEASLRRSFRDLDA
jgi:phage shock protein PspC (stress-responsive transcriptional regulator)